MEYSFKGKKILVTGAGRGIGRDVVETLVKQGAMIYALSKNTDNLKDLVDKYPSLIVPVKCDLMNWAATEKALKDIEPLDHLVNNAGVAFRENFFDIQENVFDEIFGVNVKALINVTRLVTKKMVDAKKQGSVVNVSSVSALKQSKGLLSYCASKASVDMVTKCSAVELAPYKIRVNSVNPTIVLTKMGQDLWSEALKKQALEKIPLNQFPTESQCTNAIMFLLSDLSAMTTGEFFLVDGGLNAA